jgi:putative solute:sodium symporter small subunit
MLAGIVHEHKYIKREETSVSDKNGKGEQYWRANLKLIYGCLAVWALVSYGFAILLRPLLSGIPVGGPDRGFWFAQQGSILTFIGLIFFYSWRMNKLDKKFGVEEE